MPVPPPWALDIETMVGVAITLLAVLVPVVVRDCLPATARVVGSRLFCRARGGRPVPGGPAPRESDAA